jgi:hypothetical protein
MELDIAASILCSGLSSDKADLRWQFAHSPLQAKAGFWLESILHMVAFISQNSSILNYAVLSRMTSFCSVLTSFG